MQYSTHLSQFWKWVHETFSADYRKEIEEYLSQSVDYIDLQTRMEVLQRRGII